MAAVVSMWRDPPTTTERAEHQRIVDSLSNRQQAAMNGLHDIIQKKKVRTKQGFHTTLQRLNKLAVGYEKVSWPI